MKKEVFFKAQSQLVTTSFSNGFLANFAMTLMCIMNFVVEKDVMSVFSAIVFAILGYLSAFKSSTLSIFIGFVYFVFVRFQGYNPLDSPLYYVLISVGFGILYLTGLKGALILERSWIDYKKAHPEEFLDASMGEAVQKSENSDIKETDAEIVEVKASEYK